MPDDVYSVILDGETIPFRLIRKERQKHVYLRITEQGQLTVSAPVTADLSGIHRILLSRSSWITEHLRKVQLKMETFNPTVSIMYCGIQLRVMKGKTTTGKPVLDRAQGTLTVPDHRMIEAWLRKKADRILRFRTERIAHRAGIPYSRLFVRNQRARWGSSSTNGNISLNWRAVMTPPEVQHYLIVHELAHQIHPDHSRQFWMKVASLCPDYRLHSRWLKQHGILTGLFRGDSTRGDDTPA